MDVRVSCHQTTQGDSRLCQYVTSVIIKFNLFYFISKVSQSYDFGVNVRAICETHSLCGLCRGAVWRGSWVGIQSVWWRPRCASPPVGGGTTAWARPPPTWRNNPSWSKCICVHSVFGAKVLWRPDRATATAPSPAHIIIIQCDLLVIPHVAAVFNMAPVTHRRTSIVFSGSLHSVCEN